MQGLACLRQEEDPGSEIAVTANRESPPSPKLRRRSPARHKPTLPVGKQASPEPVAAGPSTPGARGRAEYRPQKSRIYRIDAILKEGSGYPNCRTLAERFEVSAKTIQRDIEFMRDQLDRPIEFSHAHNGYLYSHPVGDLPAMTLSEGEFAALLIAEHALRQYRDTGLDAPLRRALDKLAEALPDEVTLAPTDLEHCISFGHTGTTRPDPLAFARITTALQDNRVLRFRYRSLSTGRTAHREVEPLHLGCFDHQWYLWAHDRKRKELRTFVLTRIEGEVEVGNPLRKRRKFVLNKHLERAFSVFATPGPGQEIQVRFDQWAATLIREREWQAVERTVPLDQGGIDLFLKVSSFVEVIPWVLSWGGHAEVLAPADLRSQLGSIGLELMRRYRESFELTATAGGVSPSQTSLDFGALPVAAYGPAWSRLARDPRQIELDLEPSGSIEGQSGRNLG